MNYLHLCSWKQWFHFYGALPGKQKILQPLGPLAALCPTPQQIDYLSGAGYRGWSKKNQELPHTWLTLLRNSHLPLSEYLTVEFCEKLGSKLAMSGATYCVAVSIRWVISPMKMKPGEQIYKIYLILVLVWLLSTRPKFSIWELWVLLLIKTFVQVLRLGKHPMSTDSNVQLLITLLTAIGLSAN